jgi:hypothetical protein
VCALGIAAPALLAAACSESDPGASAAAGSTGTAGFENTHSAGASAAGTSAAQSDESSPFDAPDNSAELLPFLKAGGYASWQSEPEFHVSSGPHGGSVSVFYSPKAAAALTAKRSLFPAGAATIKEAASASGSVVGWSVWVKVQDDSDSGSGFYWYEVTLRTPNDRVYADSRGSTVCVGCHSAGTDCLRSARSSDAYRERGFTPAENRLE